MFSVELSNNGNMAVEMAQTYKVEVVETNGYNPTDEELTYSGDCSYAFYGRYCEWIVRQFGKRIKAENITSADYMFRKSTLETIPFNIKLGDGWTKLVSLNGMLSGSNIQVMPKIDFTNSSGVNNCDDMLYETAIKEIPDDYFQNWDFTGMFNNTYSRMNIFNYAYYLRKIPTSFLNKLQENAADKERSSNYTSFANMKSVKELTELPIYSNYSTNRFLSTFESLFNIRNITFRKQEDGMPYNAKWKNQTISIGLTNYGSAQQFGYFSSGGEIERYGFDGTKIVASTVDYQKYKNEPDWFPITPQFSRYNHNSAVRTINSLPDTSEYLAANGGTNTITFRKDLGAKTDEGAIGELTAEEIAVAAAKGWTVSLK